MPITVKNDHENIKTATTLIKALHDFFVQSQVKNFEDRVKYAGVTDRDLISLNDISQAIDVLNGTTKPPSFTEFNGNTHTGIEQARHFLIRAIPDIETLIYKLENPGKSDEKGTGATQLKENDRERLAEQLKQLTQNLYNGYEYNPKSLEEDIILHISRNGEFTIKSKDSAHNQYLKSLIGESKVPKDFREQKYAQQAINNDNFEIPKYYYGDTDRLYFYCTRKRIEEQNYQCLAFEDQEVAQRFIKTLGFSKGGDIYQVDPSKEEGTRHEKIGESYGGGLLEVHFNPNKPSGAVIYFPADLDLFKGEGVYLKINRANNSITQGNIRTKQESTYVSPHEKLEKRGFAETGPAERIPGFNDFDGPDDKKSAPTKTKTSNTLSILEKKSDFHAASSSSSSSSSSSFFPSSSSNSSSSSSSHSSQASSSTSSSPSTSSTPQTNASAMNIRFPKYDSKENALVFESPDEAKAMHDILLDQYYVDHKASTVGTQMKSKPRFLEQCPLEGNKIKPEFGTEYLGQVLSLYEFSKEAKVHADYCAGRFQRGDKHKGFGLVTSMWSTSTDRIQERYNKISESGAPRFKSGAQINYNSKQPPIHYKNVASLS